MNRALVLTLAGTGAWLLGAVWYYDCKIKRVCGPEQASVSVKPASITTPLDERTPTAPAAEVAPVTAAETASASTQTIPPAPVAPAGPRLVLTVMFDARSAAVLPPEDVAARLATLRSGIAEGRKVLVLGHSDGRGARSRIAVVSQQRAEALRDWLLSQGIPASAIAGVESREDREPIASNSREDGRRLNRRAEAVLTALE